MTSRTRLHVLLGALLLAGGLAGCQSRGATTQPYTYDSMLGPVTLSAGDELEVKFYFTPELDVTQVVRPDGKISLQLVGDVDVDGKTTGELRDELQTMYAADLRDPEIAIIVRSLHNRRVFVAGEVITPGVVQMPAQMTALESIMYAGGFDMREAEPRNVVVIRHMDGQRFGYSVDLHPSLEGEAADPFYLLPKDIVYVPKTTIAKIGQWVDQHINRIIPQTGFIYTQPVGGGTIGIDTSR